MTPQILDAQMKMEEEKEKEGEEGGMKKVKGKGKEDSLRKVGRAHGHSGDFILCSVLCIILDRQ